MGKTKRKRPRDDNVCPHSFKNIELMEEGNDIISSLPENVLHHILSFLSTKDAIRTSILSTKWEYLWTSIANIDLKETYHQAGKKEDGSFLEFVDRVLIFHDASGIKSLSLESHELVNSSRVNSWISASIRHNIKELKLCLHWKTQPVLPCRLFTCQSLVVLKLSMDWALEVPSLTRFLNLKTLELKYVTFSDDNSTQHLFSSCPMLQELALVYCGWKNLKTITICIPTLKRLTIDNQQGPGDVLSCVTKIYAANLIHLHCISCQIIDFCLYDLSSLVDASICLYEEPEEVVTPRVLRLLTGIFNVKKLTITIVMLEFLNRVENLLDSLPTFYNMTHLVLRSEFFGHSFVLMDLLKKSPKLENLKFEQGFDSCDEDDWKFGRVPSCFASSLKTVHIARFDEKPVEMRFIRFLLKKARVLKSLIVRLRKYSEDVKLWLQKSQLPAFVSTDPRTDTGIPSAHLLWHPEHRLTSLFAAATTGVVSDPSARSRTSFGNDAGDFPHLLWRSKPAIFQCQICESWSFNSAHKPLIQLQLLSLA
ncbi:hypothetical protein Vadar_020760 [Vaccinium darrowii]|uniref:Uncharacterized protein n=1 Tax=Vaccinium darrowii TaxID=229202 RepID=A0ACB7XSQ9_9ERIC|nr:hypothetical protein Vadar_020760 [Vaccinium darrowii]